MRLTALALALLAPPQLAHGLRLLNTAPLHNVRSSRRAFNILTSRSAAAIAAAFLASSPSFSFATTLSALSMDEQDALDLASRDPSTFRSTASGLKILDVLRNEEGYAPKPNERVYCHFKVWSKGFRNGTPADSSFTNAKPYDWFLGQPPPRIVAGIDEGIRDGMTVGSFRRLVIPPELGYGKAGLRKTVGNTKSPLLIKPDEPVYADLLLMPADACDAILRAPGAKAGYELEFAHDGNAKSLLCVRGKP